MLSPSEILEIPAVNNLVCVAIVIDLLFLLIVTYNTHDDFKEYTTYILLTHGSTFILFHLLYYFNIDTILFLSLFILILTLFYLLSKDGYFIRIVSVVNSIYITGIIEQSILGSYIFSLGYGLGLIALTLLIYIALALLYDKLLLKIHTVLVCYMIMAYMISTFTGIDMLSGTYNIGTYLFSLLIGSFLLFSLIFVEFFLN